MWFGGVDIPQELVDAHRVGRLVLFIGAGASKDAPANLPGFAGLTQTVADQARFTIDPADRPLPDIVLGKVSDRGVDVHRCVADLLGDPSSTHNRLHEAIVDLALAGPEARIVTTNFDRHLTTAIDATGAVLEEYAAPALPIGSDFTGIVYLHGTLRQPPDRLVLTNNDFGNAYLRHAWAARFLERMFAQFTVLFIGYSHGDVVMRYLARALGPDGHRFVLTSSPGDSDWAHLGLRPIGYEVVGTSHAALGESVARWAEDARMGLLDHRRRIARLLDAEPSGIPEEESYLEAVVADPERVELFTEFARGPDWLDWTARQPAFSKLFARGSQPAATDRPLAEWFAEHYIADEGSTGKALGVSHAAGSYLGPDVCNAIGRVLNAVGTPRPPWLGVWLVLLIRDSPKSDMFWLELALLASRWPEDKEQILLLLDYLTEPVPGLSDSFGPGPPHLSINVRGSDHALSEAWDRIIKPNLGDAAHALAAMADRHLRRIRDLLVAAQSDNPDWDPVSFGRSAIEPHPQDNHPEPIDSLIDAARDALEVLLDRSDPAAFGYLATWGAAESQLLRRIAVHGWTHRTDVTASAKIVWVVGTGWVNDHRVRHEVFRLIAAAIPDASDDAVQALVTQLMETEPDEPDFRAYERFSALSWMDEHRPGSTVISEALAAAQAVEPAWQTRDDPDLTHSITVGFVQPRPPMTVAKLLERLAADPAGLLEALRATKGVGYWEEKSTWEDSLTLITSSVSEQPAAGFRLLDEDTADDDVTRAVIGGWSRAETDDDLAESILARVSSLDRVAFIQEIARLLSDGGTLEGHPTDWTAYPAARRLAAEIWDLVPDDESLSGDVDWLHRAINQAGGNLGEFWLRVVHFDWRADEDAWSGLTTEHRVALEAMLDSPPEATRTVMAEVVIVSRLNFLFAADPAWTTERLFPLLDWSDPVRAVRCWTAYTSRGRWNDRMLDDGLMEHFLATAAHIEVFEPDPRRRVLGNLAGIALTSQRDPLDWLPGVITNWSDEIRVAFANEITWIIDDLPGEAVEHQWDRWIRRYWARRLRSVPVVLTLEECTAMAGWVPFLSDSFTEGVDLATTLPAGLRNHNSVLRHLGRHADLDPDTCARLVGHLLRSTAKGWWGAHDLRRLWPQLRSGASPEHLDAITEEAFRLGLGDPSEWQDD